MYLSFSEHNTVGTHHAFDGGGNRRSRTNGVSNVYDTHEPALSLLYNPWYLPIIVHPSNCYFVTIRLFICYWYSNQSAF